jgi:hypothetical protein
MIKKENNLKVKVFGMLAGLFLAVTLLLSVLTTVIAYPTASHKQVAKEFTQLNNAAIQGGDLTITNSPDYKRLSTRAETKYSDTVNGVATVVQFLCWVATVVYGYRYLRKYRLVNHPVRTIAFAEALAVGLTVVPIERFMKWYAGIESTFSSDPFILTIMIITTTLISLFVTWIFAKIAEWQYNRSHGFIEE